MENNNTGPEIMTSKEALFELNDLCEVDVPEECYKPCIEIISKDLKVLEILKNILENNVLYRVFPYKMAHEFEKFLKSDKALKEWLKNDTGKD